MFVGGFLAGVAATVLVGRTLSFVRGPQSNNVVSAPPDTNADGPPPPPRPAVPALDHVVLRTRNSEYTRRSLSFWSDNFNFEPERTVEAEAYLSDPTNRSAVAFPSVRINDESVIDLFPPEMIERGYGCRDTPGTNIVDHLCLSLSGRSMLDVLGRFERNGVPVIKVVGGVLKEEEEGSKKETTAAGNETASSSADDSAAATNATATGVNSTTTAAEIGMGSEEEESPNAEVAVDDADDDDGKRGEGRTKLFGRLWGARRGRIGRWFRRKDETEAEEPTNASAAAASDDETATISAVAMSTVNTTTAINSTRDDDDVKLDEGSSASSSGEDEDDEQSREERQRKRNDERQSQSQPQPPRLFGPWGAKGRGISVYFREPNGLYCEMRTYDASYAERVLERAVLLLEDDDDEECPVA